MIKDRKLTLIIFILTSLLLLTHVPASVWAGRISPEILYRLQTSAPSSRHRVILRILNESPVNFTALKGKQKDFRNKTVVRELRRVAGQTQKSLLKTLSLNQVKGRAERIRPLWIVNSIAVDASADLIHELATAHPDIEILPDQEITLQSVSDAGEDLPAWNLDRIKAREAWELDYRGQGVIVATLDTGVDSKHPDLITRYRGGTNSWYDPATGSGVTIELTSGLFAGHGTQVMGVLVGGDASGTPIGVAPEAEFIAAKIFYFDKNSTKANESDIIDGFQWILDPDGDPYTDDSPHIVNNSWDAGSIDSISCTGEDGLLHQAVQAVREAGIFPVFAAGNRQEAVVPAAYPESVAVGGTDINNAIWTESVSGDGSGRGTTGCKGRSSYPDLVAPAVNILTSDWSFGGIVTDTGTIYRTVTGTSVAAPHIAGAAAILLSANPALTLEELQDSIESTALGLGDNNVYGKGLVDIKASLNYMFHNYPPPVKDIHVKNTGPGEFTVSWESSISAGVLHPEEPVTYMISRNGTVIADNYLPAYFIDKDLDDSASYTYSITTVVEGIAGKHARALLGNINDANEITGNRVDAFDLAALMNVFGASCPTSTECSGNWNGAADLNGDNIINDADLAILLAHFGQVIK